MTLRIRMALTVFALGWPVSNALACPFFSLYRYDIVESQYDAVAIVVVKSVSQTEKLLKAWKGTAKVIRVIEGKTASVLLPIASPGMCRENQPQPKIGERLVLYMQDRKKPQFAYPVPLWKAQKYDPRFRK